MKMQELREPATCHWDDYASLLDGALARLPRMDRDAVVLRFMQGMTLKEAGEAMGISEEAAQTLRSRSGAAAKFAGVADGGSIVRGNGLAPDDACG